MTTETTGHTPTPWAIGTSVQNDGSIAVMAEVDGERERTARVDEYETPIGAANAAFIVTAVNNFDDMVEVLAVLTGFAKVTHRHEATGDECLTCTAIADARAILERIGS